MPFRRIAEETAANAAGAAMAALAAARGAKAVHPFGQVHTARLRVTGSRAAPSASALLSEPAEHHAIVRFSRSIGLRKPLPDLLGMSVRVVDAYGPGAHQDLLMVTSVDRPLLHHIFVPAYRVDARVYSSSLPYAAGDERFIVGALPRGPESFSLAVAPLRGRFAPVADLEVGERLPDSADAMRFNPYNTGGGLEPAGALNALRRKAYPMSQRAWARS